MTSVPPAKHIRYVLLSCNICPPFPSLGEDHDIFYRYYQVKACLAIEPEPEHIYQDSAQEHFSYNKEKTMDI